MNRAGCNPSATKKENSFSIRRKLWRLNPRYSFLDRLCGFSSHPKPCVASVDTHCPKFGRFYTWIRRLRCSTRGGTNKNHNRSIRREFRLTVQARPGELPSIRARTRRVIDVSINCRDGLRKRYSYNLSRQEHHSAAKFSEDSDHRDA